ncbi:MAG: tetratricopeptide repeat protein [Candidatus Heimdallarchaeota archaeon]|nr:tetratricopeptide repeat protein [Candidatus Heimdallarchaeota archaeon]
MLPERPNYNESINTLISERKFNEALAQIQIVESSTTNLRFSEQIQMLLIKIKALFGLGHFNEALKVTDTILNNSQMLNDSYQMLDAIISKAKALSRLGLTGKALAFIKMGERVLEKLSNDDVTKILTIKAFLTFEKGFIFELEEDLKSALDSFLQSLSLYRELNDQYGLIDSNNHIAEIYFKMGDIIRSLLIYQQSLMLNKEINDEIGTAQTLNKIGKIYLWKSEFGPALENSLQSLGLSEDIGHTKFIAEALLTISEIYIQLGEFERAIQYLERTLSICEEINEHVGVANSLLLLSNVLILKGELNQAVKYIAQSQEIFQKHDDSINLCRIYGSEALIFYQKGDFDNALSYLTRCIDSYKKMLNYRDLSTAYFWSILISVELNKLEDAQDYLKRLNKNLEKQNNKLSNLEYRLASALILKRSSNLEILSKAKNILLEIVDGETINLSLTAIALFHLVELVLKEIQTTRNLDDLSQLDIFIEKHLSIAKQLESHSFFVENFWLKANFEVMNNKIQQSILLLEQAEQMAQEKGLQRLGLKITRGIDLLKDHSEKPTILSQTQDISSKTEIQVNNEVAKMIDKRIVEIPKLQNEEPVLLIIIYEGGVTVFSKKFSQKEMIDEMFVGGFLTAIDAFMHQTFATGGSIERIQHQEYTLLLKGENPLLFCYVFKGQSFSAIQKLDQIVQELKKSPTIWTALTNNLGEQLTAVEKSLIEELADQVFLFDYK